MPHEPKLELRKAKMLITDDRLSAVGGDRLRSGQSVPRQRREGCLTVPVAWGFEVPRHAVDGQDGVVLRRRDEPPLTGMTGASGSGEGG